MAAFFRQIGRRQIDCNVLEGDAKTDGVKRVADTLAAFGDGFIGEADDRKSRGPGCDADLSLHGPRFNPNEREPLQSQ